MTNQSQILYIQKAICEMKIIKTNQRIRLERNLKYERERERERERDR